MKETAQPANNINMPVKAATCAVPLLQRAPATHAVLQRKCACGESAGVSGKCETCRKKQLDVSRQTAGETQSAAVAPPIVHEALRSPGQPLDPGTRTTMESRFGHDFSQVRVHKDGLAAESAQAVNAHAYTVGRNIVFDAGQYRQGTSDGMRLLAHELTHVVQQSVRGSSGSTGALEAEAHTAGERASAGHQVSVSGATHQGALQKQEAEDEGGSIQVIAKENGRIAVVLVRNGKIVQGYAEIVPPAGVSAAEAVKNDQVRAYATEVAAKPKVDVIVPQGWARRQPVNPVAKVQIKDEKEAEDDAKRERIAAERKEKADKMRKLYREYVSDEKFQFDTFGTLVHYTGGPFGNPADTKSDDEILALQGDEFFFKWMQQRKRQSDWKSFQAQARAMGYDDPEGIKEMWKTYRQPDLDDEQKTEKQLHELKYDTERALQQNYAKPVLLNWMASKPEPVEVQSDEGKARMYVLPLPDGSFATLNEAQYIKLRQIAKDKIETDLNRIENQKGTYQYHKNDRSFIGKALDFAAGAELEGKSWDEIDQSVQAGRDALASGDLEASLAHVQDAEKQGRVANKEWERYTHHREVAGQVWITGLEVVKGGSEIVLAVGTAPLGGTGLLIVTGKGVAESVALAGAQQAGGQHVDWGDVTFDVSTQVVTGLVTHGLGKLQALGPNSAFMNAFRESYGAQVAADVVQSVLIDSAKYAAKRAYEEARGRGEKFTDKDFMEHFKKYVTDPGSLPLEIVQGQVLRHAGGPVTNLAAKHGIPLSRPPKGTAPDAPASTEPMLDKGKKTPPPSDIDSPQREIAASPVAEPEAGGKAAPAQKGSVTIEVSGTATKGKPTAPEMKPGKKSGMAGTGPAGTKPKKPPVPASSVKQASKGPTANEPIQPGSDLGSAAAGRKNESVITELPDSSVVSNLSHADATRVYENSIKDDPHRETGIWEDTKTGERVVVQGDSATVDTTTVLYSDPDFSTRQWKMVEHYHPGEDVRARIPSAQDFNVITHWQREGIQPRGAVKSEVRYIDPISRETRTTEFGYNPDSAKPYYVEYTAVDGSRQRREFVDPPWADGSDFKRFSEGFSGTQNDQVPLAASGGDVEPPTLRQPAAKGNGEPGSRQTPGAQEPAQSGQTAAGVDAEPATLRLPGTPGRPPPQPASPAKQKPLNIEQQRALNALKSQKGEVSTLYEQKAAALEELRILKAKPGKTAEDIAEMQALREEIGTLDPKHPEALRGMEKKVGKGLIADAEATLTEREKEAARAELSLYDRLRAAAPSDAAKERALKNVTTDQAGPLKTPPRGLQADHIVSVREIADMDGFANLPWKEQKAIVDMKENLVAMDGAANASKGDRTWRSWKQASNFYDQPTIERMAKKEADARAAIQAAIKDRLAKIATNKP